MAEREVVLKFSTSDGKTTDVGFKVKDGLSPCEKWLMLPENKGKTCEDYFADMKGIDGPSVVGVDTDVEEIDDTPPPPPYELTLKISEFAYANQDTKFTVEEKGVVPDAPMEIKLFDPEGALMGTLAYDQEKKVWPMGKFVLRDSFRDVASKEFNITWRLTVGETQNEPVIQTVTMFSLWITHTQRGEPTQLTTGGFELDQRASAGLTNKDNVKVKLTKFPVRLIYDTPGGGEDIVLWFTEAAGEYKTVVPFAKENILFNEGSETSGVVGYNLNRTTSGTNPIVANVTI